MHWIAHRRRGSKLGHHPFRIALVTPPLLPALSSSSLRHAPVPNSHLSLRFTGGPLLCL
jgi:hypothetical protein